MSYTSQNRVHLAALAAAIRSSDQTRHKCFVSYHQDDEDEVIKFIDSFSDVFIAKVLGVSDTDDFINSSDTDYVMRRIRELYLTDSTVTIVLIGRCTWARKYVDWEMASTLRNDSKNKRSGLLGVLLPSAGTTTTLPYRLNDNVPKVDGTDGYARYMYYPTSDYALRTSIEDVFLARSDYSRYSLIDNTRDLFKNNRYCV